MTETTPLSPKQRYAVFMPVFDSKTTHLILCAEKEDETAQRALAKREALGPLACDPRESAKFIDSIPRDWHTSGFEWLPALEKMDMTQIQTASIVCDYIIKNLPNVDLGARQPDVGKILKRADIMLDKVAAFFAPK